MHKLYCIVSYTTKYVTDVTQFPRGKFLRLVCQSLENEIFQKEAEREEKFRYAISSSLRYSV